IASPGVEGRTALFLSAGAIIGACAVWLVVLPLLRMAGVRRSSDDQQIASRVGKFFPGIRDRLLDALQLYEERERLQQNYSLELIDASFSDLYSQIAPMDFRQSVSGKSVRKLSMIAAFAIITFVPL